MSKDWTILLDMDGVVCNLIRRVAKVHQVDYHELIAKWPRGEFNWLDGLNSVVDPKIKNQAEVYSKIKKAGIDFWRTARAYRLASAFYEKLKDRFGSKNVVFATSPALDPQCAAGKIAWLYKFTKNPYFRDYMIGSRKELMATWPDIILIDDRDSNVDAFRKAGGEAVLVPRVWNSAHRENPGEHHMFDGFMMERLEKHIASY